MTYFQSFAALAATTLLLSAAPAAFAQDTTTQAQPASSEAAAPATAAPSQAPVSAEQKASDAASTHGADKTCVDYRTVAPSPNPHDFPRIVKVECPKQMPGMAGMPDTSGH